MKYLNKIYYVILIFIIVLLILSLPIGYKLLNDLNISNIEEEVNASIGTENMSEMLNKSTAEKGYEIVIDGNDYFYSSLNVDLQTLEKINVPSEYVLKSGEIEEYNYVILIPPVSFSYYYKYYAFVIILLILIVLIWNVLVIKNMRSSMLRPLQSLKRNILNLRSYNFNNLEAETQDKINEELIKFSNDLSEILNEYQYEITQKELDVYEKLEIIEKQKEYLITEIHDIKGEIINIKLRTKDPIMIEQFERIIEESNNSIKYLMSDELESFIQKTDIRIDMLIYSQITKYRVSIDAKDIIVVMKVDKITINENTHVIKQLINNLISNAIRHTPKYGEFKIYSEGKYIIFKNDSENEVDLNKIFDLNYSTTEGSKQGYGMLRIKQIIDNIGYDYEVDYLENKFIFKLELRCKNE